MSPESHFCGINVPFAPLPHQEGVCYRRFTDEQIWTARCEGRTTGHLNGPFADMNGPLGP